MLRDADALPRDVRTMRSNFSSVRRLPAVFTLLAAGYLLSSLLRGVTAALAPALTDEFHAGPAPLGLLAGAYFASFALLQLPMGAWLDRHGVRRVQSVSLTAAAASCALFAMAQDFGMLLAARVLGGIGVSACLIAPLTAARLWLPGAAQQRINAWMLMAGSLGLMLGTLPAERMAAAWGWRWLFAAASVLFLLVAVALAWCSPRQARRLVPFEGGQGSYRSIARSACMRAIGPLGFFNYAVLVAVQTLWMGPWLSELGGLGAQAVAARLMLINGLMLAVFLVMGWLLPRITPSHDDGERLLRRWTPVSIGLLGLIAALGSRAGWPMFAAYCVCAWPLSLTHPLLGQRLPGAQAGRALALFNLMLFAGAFFWQWGFGLAVAQLQPRVGTVDAYRLAMLGLALLSVAGYLLFLRADGLATRTGGRTRGSLTG